MRSEVRRVVKLLIGLGCCWAVTSVFAAASLDTIIIDAGYDKQTKIAIVPFRQGPSFSGLGQLADIVGFDLALTRAVADAVTAPVIASGGVGTLDHLVEGIIEGHATAVLAASIFHFGIHSIRQAKAHMKAAGIPVRLE